MNISMENKTENCFWSSPKAFEVEFEFEFEFEGVAVWVIFSRAFRPLPPRSRGHRGLTTWREVQITKNNNSEAKDSEEDSLAARHSW